MFKNFHNRLPALMLGVICFVFPFVFWSDLKAGEILEGPVLAQVERVIDGDTIVVRAIIWPGQSIRVLVRVNGVDTPEIRGKCPFEKKLAQFARRYVINWTLTGSVKLKNIRLGKYAGRIIADVLDHKGDDLAHGLLKNKLAYAYVGGRKESWCGHNKPVTTSQVLNR